MLLFCCSVVMKIQSISVICCLLLCVQHSLAKVKSETPFLKSKTFSSRYNLNYGKGSHVPVSFGISQKENLTRTDKQRILDMTNALRLKLALGYETHSWDGRNGYTTMPPAANMMAVVSFRTWHGIKLKAVEVRALTRRGHMLSLTITDF